MKRKWLIVITLLIGFSLGNADSSNTSFAMDGSGSEMKKHHKHHQFKEKAEKLLEQGYTKEEVFMGAMLGRKSEKDIEEVLSIYKDNNKSWDETAKKLGINSEELEKLKSLQQWGRFVEDNNETVKTHLATYINEQPEKIDTYIKEGYHLHFLIGASAISKLSNKSLEEIINYKKEGKSFHDIMKELNIKHEELRIEIEQFQKDVMKKVENN